MSRIELPKETRDALAKALSRYLKDELDLEVRGFDAVFLADFAIETFGPFVYNQAIADAQALVARKLEEVGESLYQLEKPAKR